MNNQELELRINTAVDLGNSAQSLGEVKKAMKELNFVAMQYGDTYPEIAAKATAALGKMKDKMGDAAAATRSLSGSSLENLSGSLNLVKSSITGLDFGSATTGIKNLNNTLKTISFKELGAEVASFGSSLLSLGKMILTSPIFLIGAAIAAIIQYFIGWDKVIKVVTQAFKDLTDALSLTSYAEDELNKKTIENLQKQQAEIQSRYDLEIRLANLSGNDVIALEAKKKAAILDNYNYTIQTLNNIKNKRGELKDEEKKILDETTAARKKYLEDEFNSYVKLAEDTKKANQDIIESIKRADITIAGLNGDKKTQIELGGQLEVAKLQTIKKEHELLARKFEFQRKEFERLGYEDKFQGNKERSQRIAQIPTEIGELQKQKTQYLLTHPVAGTDTTAKDIVGKALNAAEEAAKNMLQGGPAGIPILLYKKATEKTPEQIDALIKKLREEDIELRNLNSQEYKNAEAKQNFWDQSIKQEKETIGNIDILIGKTKQITSLNLEALASTEDETKRKKLLEREEDYAKLTIKYFNDIKQQKGILTKDQLDSLQTYLYDFEKMSSETKGKYIDIFTDISKYITTLTGDTEQELIRATKQRVEFEEKIDNDRKLKVKTGIEANKEYVKSTEDRLKAEQQSYEDNLNEIKNNYDAEIIAAINKGEGLLEIQKKYNKLLQSEEKTHTNTVLSIRNDGQQKTIMMFSQVNNTLMGISSALTTFQLNEANGNQSKMEKAKRQEFNRNKAFGAVSAGINTYQGITKALADYPYPLSIVMAGLVGAMGFAQVASILNSKFDSNSANSSTSQMGAFSGGSSGGSSGFQSPSSFSGPAVFNTGYTAQVPSGGPAFMRVAVVESDIRKTITRVQTMESRANVFGP